MHRVPRKFDCIAIKEADSVKEREVGDEFKRWIRILHFSDEYHLSGVRIVMTKLLQNYCKIFAEAFEKGRSTLAICTDIVDGKMA